MKRLRDQSGYSAAELLVTVAIVGLVAALTTGAWQQYRRSTGLSTTATTMKRVMNQARLQAIYQNKNFFVLLNARERTISIYEDDSVPAGTFDTGDTLLQQEQLPNTIGLGFPNGASSMPSPLGGGTVTTPFTVPAAGAGTGLPKWTIAVMATPRGQFMSTEDTSTLIGFAAMVFNDQYAHDGAISIGLEGRSGTVRAYRYNGHAWSEL